MGKKKKIPFMVSTVLMSSLMITGLASAYNDFSGWPNLKQGSSGGYVRALQSNLWAYGYQGTVGSIDGSFGSGVTSAVKSFQTKFGLSSDGSVGPATWNRMSYNVITEATDFIFYLDTPYSSTYWVNYWHPSSGNTSTLTYEVRYKSNNSVVNSGKVY